MTDDALSPQRHVLLFVPNYDASNAREADGSPLAYVKLGSAKTHESLDTAAKRGDDLLEAAGLSASTHASFFADDLRGTSCASAAGTGGAFALGAHVDHAHAAADCLAATPTGWAPAVHKSTAADAWSTSASRASLSAELLGDDAAALPRGGARDHTDGNRVVTVRGDRVDVVVGNYKRVVFGRVSGEHVGPTALEAAGGHLVERTSAGQQVYAIEHVTETDAAGATRWKVVERAQSADVVERFEGALAEHHNGAFNRRTIGLDALDAASNPEITRELDVGSLDEKIQAERVTVSREADAWVDVLDASGAQVTENSVCLEHHVRRGSSSARDYTLSRSTYAGVVADTRFFVGRAKVTVGGALFEKRIGHYAVTSGYRLDVHAGPKARMLYGSRTRMYGGSLWFRSCTGGSVVADVGVYCQASVAQLRVGPVEGWFRIGNLEGRSVKNETKVAESRALALLAEL